MSIYKSVYKKCYSSIYRSDDIHVPIPIIPVVPAEQLDLTLFLDGYLQTSFMDVPIADESEVKENAQNFRIQDITEVAAFMGGRRVNGNIPVTHFTINGEDVDFSVNVREWMVFWSVAVTTIDNVLNTYAVETRIKHVNSGFQLKGGRMKYVAGNHPLTNFDDADTGTVGRLAKAENQNIIGLKNIRFSFTR